MIGMLGGNEQTVNAIQGSIGKKITALSLDKKDDSLRFEFEDSTKLKLWDDGQNCCEYRYMTTDDDLNSFVGATLQGFRLQEAEIRDEEYDVHEVQFLRVDTSLGTFTMASHNEHNGYYGGFDIVASQG